MRSSLFTPAAPVSLDRPDAHPQCNSRTGKVGDAARKWVNREISPARFKINDEALEQPVLDVIHQVLAAPTTEDH
ncbi:hypothetical protein GCM10010428_70990 [Actinosynnema pretiosum subsp. pretiosum]